MYHNVGEALLHSNTSCYNTAEIFNQTFHEEPENTDSAMLKLSNMHPICTYQKLVIGGRIYES